MSRGQSEETEVWVDIETGEYISYWPEETKPDPKKQPEMKYVGKAPRGDWIKLDEVISADRVKREWVSDTDGPSIEGRG